MCQNAGCTVVKVNLNEVCGQLEKEHCNSTHSFRPYKTVICATIENSTEVNQYDSVCETILANESLPHVEVASNNETICEHLKTVPLPLTSMLIQI